MWPALAGASAYHGDVTETSDVMKGDVVKGDVVKGDLVQGDLVQGDAMPNGEDDAPSAVDVAEAWLRELADQVSVPASTVQDRLLDIWGALDEGPERIEVERWLTETLRRNLYSVSDINDRLESLLPAH